MAKHLGRFYSIKPLRFGAELHNIDLKQHVSPDTITCIKEDVTKYRILIFKNQGVISGERHVEISKWFGELESTFYKHPKSPHPDVFRVSNDEKEGCTGVGRTGWHIDGTFQPSPFAYSLYHMVYVPTNGDTVFAPLTEIIERLDVSKRARWEHLYMLSDRRGGVVHPIIYSHPVTKHKVLCVHMGMTTAFMWDYDKPDERRLTSDGETRQILDEIHEEFVRDNRSLQYSHHWEEGDFIISDNLAVGHEASESTQYPLSQVGLRVLHRTTVKGTHTLEKEYAVK